jgi:acetyl-CoA acyltransferase
VRGVAIAGVGMTPFGKHRDRSLRSLVAEAVGGALADATVSAPHIEAVYFGNASAGVLTGQEMIRGQVLLQDVGLGGAPIVNVENACASSATAVQLAMHAILAEQYDVALVVGAEKMVVGNRHRVARALAAGLDVEAHGLADYVLGDPSTENGAIFMDIYAREAEAYLERGAATREDFARVATKSRAHGALNARAQFRRPVTIEQVLNDRTISGPLTLSMCSPITDGAASLVLASERWARQHAPRAPRLRACSLGSGGAGELTHRTAHRAYDQAGVEPADLDLVELHDATASAELLHLEQLGLAEHGGAADLLRDHETSLDGRIPTNVSGGLLSRGHPLGATGAAQLVELADQLRDRCGPRQVRDARLALAHNAGGHLGGEEAAAVVTILERGPRHRIDRPGQTAPRQQANTPRIASPPDREPGCSRDDGSRALDDQP